MFDDEPTCLKRKRKRISNIYIIITIIHNLENIMQPILLILHNLFLLCRVV